MRWLLRFELPGLFECLPAAPYSAADRAKIRAGWKEKTHMTSTKQWAWETCLSLLIGTRRDIFPRADNGRQTAVLTECVRSCIRAHPTVRLSSCSYPAHVFFIFHFACAIICPVCLWLSACKQLRLKKEAEWVIIKQDSWELDEQIGLWTFLCTWSDTCVCPGVYVNTRVCATRKIMWLI